MDDKWVVKTVAELAFVRELMKLYGYGLEKGIILIADDEESALAIKSMLEAHLDAVGMKLRGRKESQPLNYQMGVHVYNRLDDERKLLDFLEEQEFLPVLITGGLIPKFLVGRGYAFRCVLEEAGFMTAEAQYKEFVASIKRDVPTVVKVIQEVSTVPDVLSANHRQYRKYEKVVKNLLAIMCLCEQVYKTAGASEEKLAENNKAFKTKIEKAIAVMDRYEGEYDVQDVVRECFLRQAKKGDVRLSPVGISSAVDEAESHILYDDNFYYVADPTLRKICAPLLETVSFVQLKNEMAFSGMVDCNDGSLKNFTKKKLIWRSYDQPERIRLIWIKKESLMTDEGLLLENMWEDKA